ncbi:PucR family transcriptional regulator [Gordonia mangrovi]|nr:helix-turn-helix domain-containing protein [Gordonia mangrovi]UVF76414.1 helix-turn-helix domain-containing protein [Gordonia mangrovi]
MTFSFESGCRTTEEPPKMRVAVRYSCGIHTKEAIMVQVDWGPVVDRVDVVLDRLDVVTDHTVARIRSELVDFALVPYAEHRVAVREQLKHRLMAFRERRVWHENELDGVRQLARRRAHQTIALDAVIRAYYVGDQELWKNLSSESDEAQPLLPELASLMLESLQSVTSTLALAHGSEVRTRDRARMAVSQRLIDLLSSRSLEIEAARLAEYLGFEVEQPFAGIAYAAATHEVPQSIESLEADLVERRLVAYGGIGTTRVLLSQAGDADVEQIAELLTTAGYRVGIGSNRAGIAGASRSLRQAQLALDATTPGNIVSRFSSDWIINCVVSLRELLEDEVFQVAEVARAHRSLRDTVIAYSESDMSIRQCARMSHLHANTVVYRLSRWHELTGWDPRTFLGLTHSVVACALADSTTAP